MFRLFLPSLGLALLLFLMPGCSNSSPNRFKISGEVTYCGEPVPYGDIVFTPDAAQKNSGPQGFAVIRDGKYDSSTAKGKGFAGGPTILQISGFSGPKGEGLLFETQMKADLPRESSTHNIEVPKVRKVSTGAKF